MTGMMMFWGVLTLAALALVAATRIYPLLLPVAGFAGALMLALQGMGVLYQLASALLLLGLGIFFWVRRLRPEKPLTPHPHPEAGPSRLSGLGALSNFSAFSDEPDEVQVESWNADGDTSVIFRGRPWKARLAKGARAHAGLYKVREVRDGKLILDEVID